MEFYDVHLSYIDLETNEEKIVRVKEQGGDSLIPDDPLNPGSLYTVGRGSSGHLGLYRLETQVTAGNGQLKLSGFGSNTAAKESVNVGFDYFRANATQIQASLKVRRSQLPPACGRGPQHRPVHNADDGGLRRPLFSHGRQGARIADGGAGHHEPGRQHRARGEPGGIAPGRR